MARRLARTFPALVQRIRLLMGTLTVFAGVTAILIGCQSSRLPPSMPDDFSATVYQNMGMVPYSKSVAFSLHGSEFTKSYHGTTSTFSFVSTAEELKKLYRVVVQSRFDRITAHSERIYDRGGTATKVTAQGKTYTATDGGMSVIDKAWVDNYRSVVKALSDLEAEAFAKYGCTLRFTLSESVKGFKDLYIGLDGATLSFHPDHPVASAKVTVFPGEYWITLGVDPAMPYQTLPVRISASRDFYLVFDGKAFTLK